MTAGRSIHDDSRSIVSECRSCALLSVCGQPPRSVSVAPLRGRSLATAAVGFFFLPLFSAIGGALLGGSDPTGQLIGGFAGLGAGMLAARIAAAFATRHLCASSFGGES